MIQNASKLWTVYLSCVLTSMYNVKTTTKKLVYNIKTHTTLVYNISTPTTSGYNFKTPTTSVYNINATTNYKLGV